MKFKSSIIYIQSSGKSQKVFAICKDLSSLAIQDQALRKRTQMKYQVGN